jgi:hypothetical protein
MPYNFPCAWKDGFMMDPVKKQRVGYLTDFNGLGLAAALAKDISAYCPFNNASAPAYAGLGGITENKVTVTAVLENVSWNGGVGDPISISMYMSSENSNLLKTLKQMTLKTTSILKMGWWIANFDEVTKTWYEETYPKAPVYVTGQVNAVSKTDVRMHIADEAVKISPNIDVSVYNVYMEIVPAANATQTYTISSSPTMTICAPWGVVVGTLPGKAVPAAS